MTDTDTRQPTAAAKRAAEKVDDWQEYHATDFQETAQMDNDEVAMLIDRATGLPEVEAALAESIELIDALLASSVAPDQCSPANFDAAKEKISERGGRIGWIADVQKSNRKALARLRGADDQPQQ